MASDKRLDQVKLVNSAESVLVVNGDKVEKATLAGFANSMGSSVPLQQTSEQVNITGLYARTSDGKMVELTKESVASVMGNLLYGADNASSLASVVAGFLPFVKNTSLTSGDFNEIINNGTYIMGVATSNFKNAPAVASLEGILFVKVSFQEHLIQLYADIQGGTYHFRSCYGNSWRPWQRIDNFGYNTLAELSSGVAEQLSAEGGYGLLKKYDDIVVGSEISNSQGNYICYANESDDSGVTGLLLSVSAWGITFQLKSSLSSDSFKYRRSDFMGAWSAWRELL